MGAAVHPRSPTHSVQLLPEHLRRHSCAGRALQNCVKYMCNALCHASAFPSAPSKCSCVAEGRARRSPACRASSGLGAAAALWARTRPRVDHGQLRPPKNTIGFLNCTPAPRSHSRTPPWVHQWGAFLSTEKNTRHTSGPGPPVDQLASSRLPPRQAPTTWPLDAGQLAAHML